MNGGQVQEPEPSQYNHITILNQQFNVVLSFTKNLSNLQDNTIILQF